MRRIATRWLTSSCVAVPAARLFSQEQRGPTIGNRARSITAMLEHDDDHPGPLAVQQQEGDAIVDPAAADDEPTIRIEEHSLLDDAFTYFPALEPEAQRQRVPGEPLIPPGFTRYRVDVQFQGNHFDGWSKSTARRVVVRNRDGGEAAAATALAAAAAIEQQQAELTAGALREARAVVEDALSVALDVDSVTLVSSVLPEAGTHVRRLVCHCDVPSGVELQPRTVLQRASMWLHKKDAPLALLSFQRCRNQAFDARHSAVQRVYVYRILNRVAPPLFDAGLQWHVDRYLDADRMARFAERLQGTMDFGFFADPRMASTLRKAAAAHTGGSAAAVDFSSDSKQDDVRGGGGGGGLPSAAELHTARGGGRREDGLRRARGAEDRWQRMSRPAAAHPLPTTRTVDSLRVVRQDDEVLVWCVGRSFLRHQVRGMVAALVRAGHGLWSERDLEEALRLGFEPSRRRAARDRLAPAPVHGLTLWDVQYPPEFSHDFVPFVDSGPLEEAGLELVN